MQLELTLGLMARFISLYYSQHHVPVSQGIVGREYGKTCRRKHAMSHEDALVRLVEANRVHLIVLPSGYRSYMPKAVWDRLTEYERVGVVAALQRK